VFLLGDSARGTRTGPGGQPAVAITVGPAGGERWREVQSAQVDAIHRLLEREVVTRVIAVSQVEGHDDDDSEMLEHLLGLIAELPHEVAARDLSVGALMDLYSGTEIQIGSRVHSTILSAASGTPGIAMQTDGRAREIFDLVGLGQLVLDPFIPHQLGNRLTGMDLDSERTKTVAAATNAAKTTRSAAEALRERL
jgi:polysaccharide pyruvyl transferase WcaK-like protein